MQPCIACEEKHRSHTITAAENRCNPKKQPPPTAVLWHPTNHHTHIKRENDCTLAVNQKIFLFCLRIATHPAPSIYLKA
jgi:hypothetical protein